VPRILVADDNTNIQKMVTLAFQERGVEVIAVGNGEAAVRRIPDANPDLVLADVFMPVRNGYEVCEFVKKDTRFSHTPVILLVGAFDPLDEKEARRVGADGVLKKPFVPPDPLIAMVMSALEKNPRVAAELAKAKEVVAVVETPLPAAALEIPAMAEPKPLPEFPEPTPEEAAVIYGFGKGVRAMDLDEDEEDEDSRSKKKTKEAPAPKAPAKNEKAPKIATGPKTQVAVPDDDEEGGASATASSNDDENEDQFDGSATASDWRRSAADFEVPENVAADPVYSYGKNFEPITFPSERDVPPKRVRVESKAEEPAAAAHEKVAASESVAEAVAPAASAFTADGAKSAAWEASEHPAVQAEVAPGNFAVQEVPLIEARVSEPEVAAPAPETFFAEPATKQPAESEKPEAEYEESHESAARPSFVSRVRGWMDMMSPSHSESEDSGDHWMNKIAEPSAAERSGSSSGAGTQRGEAAARAHEPEAPAETAASLEYAAEVHAETQEVPAVAPSPLEPIPAEEMAATSYTVAEEAKAEQEPRQFGESKFAESGLGGTSYHFSDDAHSDFHDAGALDAGSEPREEAQAASSPSPSVFHEETRREEPAFDAAAHSDSFPAEPQPVRSGAADFSPELLSAPADASRNGDLAAEHKPFEPLLVDEEHHEPSDYFAAPQEAQRPMAREEEVPTEASQPAQRFLPKPGEDYWNHEAAAHEESVFPGAPGSIFADSVPPPVTQEFFERVPTLPPPNREALSEIPFLMPPLPSAPADSSTPTGATNADTVDEVVRRVLEKLQPQLHELLSQGVKPLIENLLQNELHKKEK
jgi:CheY-like chemotaxis protein